jgi:hypothetical protein
LDLGNGLSATRIVKYLPGYKTGETFDEPYDALFSWDKHKLVQYKVGVEGLAESDLNSSSLTKDQRLDIFDANFYQYGKKAAKSIGYDDFQKQPWKDVGVEGLILAMSLKYDDTTKLLNLVEKSGTQIEGENFLYASQNYTRGRVQISLKSSGYPFRGDATIASGVDWLHECLSDHTENMEETANRHDTAWLVRNANKDKRDTFNGGGASDLAAAKGASSDNWFNTTLHHASETAGGERFTYLGVAAAPLITGLYQLTSRLRAARLIVPGGSASSFPEWAQQGLEDIARFRKELGPIPGGGTADGGVVARLDVGGRSFYGINGHGQATTLRANPITLTHAEGDVFQQAANAGMRGGSGRLFVDSALCGYCGRSGGVRSLVRGLGLERLEVVTPLGIRTILP